MTIPSGYCLCSLFAPGDRQVLVGTKRGSIQIFDIASAEMTEEIEDAHQGEIWSMSLSAGKRGFVTASADKTVKFWDFELLNVGSRDGGEEGASSNNKKLSIVHSR